ncbi:MAG: hypothetical protein LBE51_08715 [Acidovorax sp.]|jgi:hypothetical protein|nr:hypothetical protein [Acidovorax sp.]
MTAPLTQRRAREALQAAQRADQAQRRQRVTEAKPATWWPTNNPTRCISCNAELPPNYQTGQELACGH